MKKLKWCIAIMMISLTFMLGSELYQNYLKTFTNQFYYFEVNEPEKKEEAVEIVKEISEKRKVGVFAVSIFVDTAFSSEIKVYVTEDAIEILDECYVSEGVKECVLSGKTSVIYEEFSKLKDSVAASQKYYFTGTKEDVISIKKEISEQYNVSRFVRIEQADSFDFLIWAVWGLVFGILLILTVFDIKLKSKEHFIQMSMGVRCKSLVIKNVLLDICAFVSIFGAICFVQSSIFDISYKWLEIIYIFVLFLVLNSSLYLNMFRYEYKQILYGAVINYKTLGNCYILKAISMIIAIITLALSMELVFENVRYLNMYDEIERYNDYYYLSIKADTSMAKDFIESAQIYSDTKSKIFYDYYMKGKVALDVSIIVDENDEPIISVNKYVKGLPKFIREAVDENYCGYYIFIPQKKENDSMLAEDVYIRTKLSLTGFKDDTLYKTIIYDEDIEMLYFDSREVSTLPFGFGKEKNPIIVYFSSMEHQIDYHDDLSDYVHDNIMYHFTQEDLNMLKETYNLQKFKVTEVTEYCEQYRAYFWNKVIMVVGISLFMIVLEIIIMIVIIRTEYVVNAKELVVKKVLGYGMLKKNGELILLNLFSTLIAVGTMITIHFMYGVLDICNIFVAGALIYILEQIFMMYYIIKVERVNVSKILKGGCL